MKVLTSYGFLISCPLCKSKKYRVLYKSTLTRRDLSLKKITENLKNSLDDYTKHAQIVKCINCSLVYTNPIEDIKKMLIGYEDVVDYEYLQTERYRRSLLLSHLKKIEQLSDPGKILDIGCFVGYFLELAKSRGWEAEGIEPSKWAIKEAKKRNMKIVGKTIEDISEKFSIYDAVTMWDVIEHLPNPQETMRLIKRLIKKNGIVAIGTPNIDSIFARIMGAKCPFLIRMHLVIYSPKTLRKLFENNGFKVIYFSRYARIFPLSYILEGIRINNVIFSYFKKLVSKIDFIAELPVSIPFGESIIMVGQRVS